MDQRRPRLYFAKNTPDGFPDAIGCTTRSTRGMTIFIAALAIALATIAIVLVIAFPVYLVQRGKVPVKA